MKVSVVMITYNHEKYIAEAIESVLMQNVNFEYEIVIGEDCSLDRTREIVVEFQNKFPDKIKLLLAEKNYGDYGLTNFLKTLAACKGEYIAVLDGDDYWTSPDKLQRQVDFLDTHRECSICFHKVKRTYEDGSWNLSNPREKKRFYSIKDLFLENFIPFCSTMFRNGLFEDLPKWFYNSNLGNGDFKLHLLNAQHGKIGYINEVMAVYRKHGESFMSKIGNIQLIQRNIELYNILKTELFQYENIINMKLSRSYFQMSRLYAQKLDKSHAREYFSKGISISSLHQIVFFREFYLAVLLQYFPWLFNFMKKVVQSTRSQNLSLHQFGINKDCKI